MLLIAIIAAATIVVIDGDTVRVDGQSMRLEGLDTPETYRPECRAEAMLGALATARMQEFVDEGARIEATGRIGYYGRPLIRMTVAGEDVAEMLISEGLATPYEGRQTDWCGSL